MEFVPWFIHNYLFITHNTRSIQLAQQRTSISHLYICPFKVYVPVWLYRSYFYTQFFQFQIDFYQNNISSNKNWFDHFIFHRKRLCHSFNIWFSFSFSSIQRYEYLQDVSVFTPSKYSLIHIFFKRLENNFFSMTKKNAIKIYRALLSNDWHRSLLKCTNVRANNANNALRFTV